MNKSKKQLVKKAAGKGLAAAYVTYEGSLQRGGRSDSGVDVIEDTVLGDPSFTCIGYPINPGLALRFPALSQEAKRYDCYEFLELSFRFIGTTVISTTVGQIGLAFDPNPHTQAPSTQSKFSAYECHVSSSVYKPDGLTLKVPKHMLQGRRYVRSGIEGGSLFMYDPGMLVIMVRDEANQNAIGYVEVRYKIRFTDFHLEPTTTPVSHRVIQITKTASQNLVSTVVGDWAFDSCVGVDGMEHSLASSALTLYAGVYRVTAIMEFSDNTNEEFKANLNIYVDGVSKFGQTSQIAAGAASEFLQMVGDVVIASASTTVITIPVALVGAAGTLTIDNVSKLIVVAY
jgi:hypothetical protein